MLGQQQSIYGIQSTAGAVPIRNEKGKQKSSIHLLV